MKPKRKRFTKCSTRGCKKTRPTGGLPKGASGEREYTCHGGRCPIARRKK